MKEYLYVLTTSDIIKEDEETRKDICEFREYFTSFRKLKRYVKNTIGKIYYDEDKKLYIRYLISHGIDTPIESYSTFKKWFNDVIIRGKVLHMSYYGCKKFRMNKKK